MEPDAEAERIRSLVLLRATCATVVDRLNEDDLGLAIQIRRLCETLDSELDKLANRGIRN
jgi:hypothetical protein